MPTGHPAAGAQLGPYRIVREIGIGGMGVVYEAVDIGLDRAVALKVISSDLAADADFRERFRREARALAGLESPHVVQVHAFGEADGALYLATSLAPDGDLARYLRENGPLPVTAALDLVAQVAAGVAAVHRAGLVHRDVKPANVLLRRRDAGLVAYLGDFGIAGPLEDRREATSALLGTPSSMAPELHAGAVGDVRSDVYALGCLLWTVLTGRPPYVGTQGDVIRGHRTKPVPQLQGRTSQLREINRILRRALAKDPTERHVSAAELREELRRARSLPSGVRSRRLPALALGVALVVAAGVALGGPGADREEAATDGHGAPAPALDPARAAHSLARVLLDRGVVIDRRQAACTAEAWIGDVGLARLVAEGYFTRDMEYVDLEIGSTAEETRLALAAATRSCLRR